MKEPNGRDYWNWRGGCLSYGYEVQLSMEQWINWWKKTKQYDNRGRFKGNVCMSRRDTELPFSLSNIKLMSTAKKNARNKKH